MLVDGVAALYTVDAPRSLKSLQDLTRRQLGTSFLNGRIAKHAIDARFTDAVVVHDVLVS